MYLLYCPIVRILNYTFQQCIATIHNLFAIAKNRNLKISNLHLYFTQLSLFVVLSNETEGIDICTGQDTLRKVHKNNWTVATTSGCADFQRHFEDLIAIVESEDEAGKLLEEGFERQVRGLVGVFDKPVQALPHEIYDDTMTVKS